MSNETKVRIIALWNEGLSALQIARQLAPNVICSRNAVIGIIHRLREKGDTVPPELRPRDSTAVERSGGYALPRNFAVRVRLPAPPAPSRKTAFTPPPPPPPPKVKDAPARIEIMPLNPMPWTQRAFGQCAFPLEADGSPAIRTDSEVVLSCCDPVHVHPRRGAQKYCLTHCEVMFWTYGKERALSALPHLKTDGRHVT